MKKLHFALAGAAALALGACGSRTDNVQNIDANGASQTDQLNRLADDAANQAEAEALGNQQERLEQRQEDAANADTAADPTVDANPDENVSGM